MSDVKTPERSAVALVESIDPMVRVEEMGLASKSVWDSLTLFGASNLNELSSQLAAQRDKNLETAFQMSLGLARLNGEKDVFEELAVEYATQFDNSPPVWLEAHTKLKHSEDVLAPIVVSSLAEDTIVDVTINMETHRPIEMDMSRVRKADKGGIELFWEALNGRLQRGERTKLLDGKRVIEHLTEQISSRSIATNQSYWLLVMTYYQINGEKSAFDKVVSAYVAAGGVAPPWVDLSEQEEKHDVAVNSGIAAPDRLSKMTPELAQKIARGALAQQAKASGTALVIDFVMTEIGSIKDGASVAAFVRTLHKEKIEVAFVNVNEILIALLSTMGVLGLLASISAPGAGS